MTLCALDPYCVTRRLSHTHAQAPEGVKLLVDAACEAATSPLQQELAKCAHGLCNLCNTSATSVTSVTSV